jgi:glycosyltransferase involved in cell wall biosynthesis
MIPAYNEENTIGDVIKEIPREVEGFDDVKILVINDGSSDNTAEVAKKAGADYIVSHKKNLGLGNAFKTGLENALKLGAEVIVNIDADNQFNPKEIPKLTKPILDGKADIVTGSRFISEEAKNKIPTIKKLGNKIFSCIMSLIIGEKLSDTQCGFRAYSRESAMRATTFSRFTYTQEVLLDLINKGMVVEEIPISVRYFKNRKSKIVKNPVRYGINALIIILRTIRDIKPFLFFGSIGSAIFFSGFLMGLWLFIRWILIGKVTPYKSMVTLSAVLMILGFLLLILALIADMQGRVKKLLDENLYFLKKLSYLREGLDEGFDQKNSR